MHGPALHLLPEGQAVTPHERAMEELALKLADLNRFDSTQPTIPTDDDSEDTE